ncbi:hypothetical protein JG688_00009063 [Phytophthora aleatoria]|uniref:Uncharacterized protein n=1 Tax=Phytophthora aleatoria TaxID=2496075 RepID=A0A8J5IU70_9STRA|nr:hypothetical protein JG688_00009063 [Phytophthora aleatoria]
MVGITTENVGARISPVFMFGLLQIASFVLLLAMVKRNCMMRALYQLAFVLESQLLVVTGVDFTFKFSGFGYKFSSSSTEE